MLPVAPAKSNASGGATGTGTVMPYTAGSPPLLPGSPGNVAPSMTAYAIWWNPGHLQDGTRSIVTLPYKNLIVRFFHDYSGNGVAQNNTQYHGYRAQASNYGFISSTTHFGAAWTVTTPFPTGHCVSNATGTNCVDQSDLAMVASVAAQAHGVTAGTNKEFFVYTPKGEGSCYSTGEPYCSYSYYCAWHSYTSARYGPYPSLVYANQPWPTMPNGSSNCMGNGQTFPSGNANADAAVNLTSHELTESITDPLINNWRDSSGYEIGDECVWEFGAVTTGGGDVLWNGHPYSIQPEASNFSAGCVLSGP